MPSPSNLEGVKAKKKILERKNPWLQRAKGSGQGFPCLFEPEARVAAAAEIATKRVDSRLVARLDGTTLAGPAKPRRYIASG